MSGEVGKSGAFAEVEALARRAKAAAPALAAASPAQRDTALRAMAAALRANLGALLEANGRDVADAEARGVEAAFLDRLRLDEARVAKMADAILEVAALPSPLGGIEDMTVRPNGLRVGRMRIPLGVIAIIYEARPNVTSDAASLCMKAGNAVILKGGRDARHSNEAVAGLLRQAMDDAGLPRDAIQYLGSSDREELAALLKLDEHIDLVIPRGGEALIRFVAEHSRIPVLKHYKGVCHVYVDAGADVEMAVRITENAKVQRPSVCNAAETLLVHRDAAQTALPAIARRLVERGVTLHGCPETVRLLTAADVPCEVASEDDYYAEYLSLDLAVRVVEDMQAAMEHIRRYGSDHTEAIVTSDYQRAMAFVAGVDSSTVLVNASTRFADGGELGLGAEVGISTSRLHSYGPMGLLDLTARKFVVFGDGQVRT
jgi:glutamate-5-semialdehyde dehydrogenase